MLGDQNGKKRDVFSGPFFCLLNNLQKKGLKTSVKMENI